MVLKSDVGAIICCLRGDYTIEMRNYKRAKPRFGGTGTSYCSKLLGAKPEPRQSRGRDGNTMWGFSKDNTARKKREKGKETIG